MLAQTRSKTKTHLQAKTHAKTKTHARQDDFDWDAADKEVEAKCKEDQACYDAEYKKLDELHPPVFDAAT